MCALAGLGREYLEASDPDDIAILTAIAEAAASEREREREDLAHRVAQGTRAVLGG